MATAVAGLDGAWSHDAVAAVRRFAAITAAGAVSGVLVGGVGGRLAMLLIARLNPAATGRMSDDGFRMGQFTPSGSFNLLLTGLLLGLLASMLYAAVRHLMIGPRWFRRLSISLGPAIVAGSMLVHTTGVDFTLLQPAALSIALFVALPGLAVLLLTVLAERWLDEGAWPGRAPLWALAPVFVLYGPVLVFVAVAALLWSLRWYARRDARIAGLLDHRAVPWVLRGGLTAVFTLALVELLRDVAVLT